MAMSVSLVMAMSAAVSTSVSMAVSMVVVVAMMTRNIVVRDSCILVKGCNDRVAYFLHVLLLVLVFLLAGQLVLPDPLEGLVTLVQDGFLLVADLDLVQLRVLHSRLEVEAVSLQTQLSFQALRLLLVVFLELLSVLHHLLNLVLGQPALVVGDRDLRLLAGRLVQGAHVQDPVRVDIKRDLNLRFSSRSWLDTTELEVAKKVVVLCQRPFPLEHGDGDCGLVVLVGGEGLGLLRRDRRVPLDDVRLQPARGLDAKGEGSNVEEKEVVHHIGLVPIEDRRLHSSPVGDCLVRVDRLVQLFSVKILLKQLLNLGNPGRPSHQNDLFDGHLFQLGVLQCLLHRNQGVLEKIRAKLLESGSRYARVEIDPIINPINLNPSLGSGGQGSLGSLASGSQPPQSSLVAGQVPLVLPLELGDEVVDQPVVKVLPAEVCVTRRGLHLEDAVVDVEDGDVKGAATEVEDVDVHPGLTLLVQAVGDGGSGRLVDDSEDVEASDGAGILGLGVEECLDSLLHLGQHHRADLLGEEGLLLRPVLHLQLAPTVIILDHLERPMLHVRLNGPLPKLPPNQPFCVKDCVRRVEGHLILRRVSNKSLGVCECNVAGGGSVAHVVGDDLHLAMLEDGSTGVGGAQVYAHSWRLGFGGGCSRLGWDVLCFLIFCHPCWTIEIVFGKISCRSESSNKSL